MNELGPGVEPRLVAPALSVSRAAEPTVSVIITCYNQAQFLEEAIESALQQTYPASEIIVVDDGSTDGTPGIAARYRRVRYVRQRNQGLSSASNVGLKAARCPYLTFLAADDRLLPGAIKAGVSCIETRPDCAFVSGHYRMIDADGGLLDFEPCACAVKNHYRELLRGNYIGMHATVLYRRGVLQRVGGFDVALQHCEDYELYLRIARSWPIYCHHRVVAEYRLHGANKSRRNHAMLRSVLRVLRAQSRYVRGSPDLEEAYRAGIYDWQRYYGEPLIGETVAGLRDPTRWTSVAVGVASLLRYYPRGLCDLLAHKISAARARRRHA